MRNKTLKIAILLGLGLFFINACLGKPAPVKHDGVGAWSKSEINLAKMNANLNEKNANLNKFGEKFKGANAAADEFGEDFKNKNTNLNEFNSKINENANAHFSDFGEDFKNKFNADFKSEKSTLPVILNFAGEANFTRLKSDLKKANLHLRIFGDSHTAADFFSSRLREHIKTNAVGFIYPLQPKYQRVVPVSYKSKNFELLNSKSKDTQANFAMGGIIAKALKKGAFITLDNEKNPKSTLVAVYKSPHTKDAFVIKDGKNKRFVLRAQKRGKWSFARIKSANFPLKITALDKNVLLGGFFILNEKNNAVIDTLGINGAKSDLWQKWNEGVFLEQLNLYKSDIVVLAYGSNDALVGGFDEAQFKQGYKKLIALLYRSNPQTHIVLIAPPTITHKVGKGYELHEDFYRVQKALYELARDERLVLFDMHAVIENSGGKAAWIEQNLSREDVHLTPAGYQKMADEFYQSLMR